VTSRLDLVLKHLCLARSRSSAKNLCDGGFVLVNGSTTRASANIKVGDRITMHLPRSTKTIELIEVPHKQVAKAAASDFYRRVTTPPTEERPEEVDPLEGW